jgi:hypothetical protein
MTTIQDLEGVQHNISRLNKNVYRKPTIELSKTQSISYSYSDASIVLRVNGQTLNMFFDEDGNLVSEWKLATVEDLDSLVIQGVDAQRPKGFAYTLWTPDTSTHNYDEWRHVHEVISTFSLTYKSSVVRTLDGYKRQRIPLEFEVTLASELAHVQTCVYLPKERVEDHFYKVLPFYEVLPFYDGQVHYSATDRLETKHTFGIEVLEGWFGPYKQYTFPNVGTLPFLWKQFNAWIAKLKYDGFEVANVQKRNDVIMYFQAWKYL